MEGQQIGVIVYGNKLNPRPWIEQAKREGQQVLLENGRAEIWEKPKKK